jgi:DNA adenine methylase
MTAADREVQKAIDSSTGGLKHPAGSLPSGIKPDEAPEEETGDRKLFIPIAKADLDQRTVTGVVLQPEVIDGQGDIMSAEVIKKAAYRFLADYNKSTQIGLMHKDFKQRFELVECYITPQDLKINGVEVPEGSWVITVRVLDKDVWAKVKKGELTGFSIGGKARVVKLKPNKAA